MADVSCSPLPVGGYDLEFIDGTPDSWECPVCLLVLRDPHLLSCCGVKICQSCISGITSSSKPCPKCRGNDFTTLLEKELQRSILGSQVKCNLGCEWFGELRCLDKHTSPLEEGTCPLSMVTCRYGCGQAMMRSEEATHVENVCPKQPIEVKLIRLQVSVDKQLADMKSMHEVEVRMLKTEIENQKQQIQEMREEIKGLKTYHGDELSTTIPVFSSSILCIMPKLPNGNINGVSYYPKDKFVKIVGSCDEELEARTHLFLAEYEKILPRLVKESFVFNDHFPQDILKTLIDTCNKKFSGCFISNKDTSVELVSINASQFELAKKLISEKLKHKMFRMRFPGNMRQTFTLKHSNIKDEAVDVIVQFTDPSPSSPGFTSFFSTISGIVVPPGEALLIRERKHSADNVIFISSMHIQRASTGYFGKESYELLSKSIKDVFIKAATINAKSISFPCEFSSGSMQSNYIIPAVMERAIEDLTDNHHLTDIRILIQDDKIDGDQLSSYFKYLALKYHLQ